MLEEIPRHGIDVSLVTSLHDLEYGLLRHLIHEADAARAEDAAIAEVDDLRRYVVATENHLGVGHTGVELSSLERVVLQLALAGGVTDRAVEGMIHQEKLDDGAPCFASVGARRMHDHVVLDLLHARGQQFGCALDLDQAHAA